jgi:hypothetical protein
MLGCGGEARSRIGDDGASTLFDCLRNIAIAVGRASAKGDKERPFAYTARIVFDASYLGGWPRAADNIDTLQYAVEVHASLLRIFPATNVGAPYLAFVAGRIPKILVLKYACPSVELRFIPCGGVG